MLNERQKKIIRILKDDKGWMIGGELSDFLSVSDRTIRSDIEYINKYYNDTLIESNVRNGYHLNPEALSNFNINSENTIPQNSFERCFYILHELLYKRKELNLIDIMDELFVSSSSIENDLAHIKRMLKPYPSLKLYRSRNYICLKGSEENIRKLYINLLKKRTKGNFFNLNFLAAQFLDFNLLDLKELIEEIFDKYNYSIRGIELPMLMIYIGVAIERMLYHNHIKTDKKKEDIMGSIEFAIAEEFFGKVLLKLYIESTEDEIIYLALLLLGKIEDDRGNVKISLSSDYTVNQLVNDILQDINTQFDMDLRNDGRLKKGLSAHIKLLLERKKKNIDISNLFMDELKYKYPLFFEMAVMLGKLMQDKLNVTLDESDISLIAQHLGGRL